MLVPSLLGPGPEHVSGPAGPSWTISVPGLEVYSPALHLDDGGSSVACDVL